MVKKFKTIHDAAIKRKGGEAALQKLLPKTIGNKRIAAIADDRVLSEMSRCVFQAGFVWRVVNQKWPDFEKVFFGFEAEKIILLSPEQIEQIGRNPAIIRNMQKILSVQQNAQMLLDIAKEHGSFGTMVAAWPRGDHIGLFKLMKQKGSRLGGATGPRTLRNLQIDTFVLTDDVVNCLQQAGLEISKNPSSQRDLKAIQQAFNRWHEESGLKYCHMSRICAYSVGENYPVESLLSVSG